VSTKRSTSVGTPAESRTRASVRTGDRACSSTPSPRRPPLSHPPKTSAARPAWRWPRQCARGRVGREVRLRRVAPDSRRRRVYAVITPATSKRAERGEQPPEAARAEAAPSRRPHGDDQRSLPRRSVHGHVHAVRARRHEPESAAVRAGRARTAARLVRARSAPCCPHASTPGAP
jgi:hypothetical protein